MVLAKILEDFGITDKVSVVTISRQQNTHMRTGPKYHLQQCII